jgi:UDP-3-O-[3-hydroxymyristoyl] N-acetylglucosamine deacetylase/3-hydroxyacyl-[acyl-carrier-protein] dehydratase
MRKYRYDIQDILKIMPHRYPFLLVDRILELKENAVVGIKNVTINEPFFAGHFPGEPVMPGVLIIEAMAQVGGFLLLNRVDSTEDKLLFFMMIDKVKFRKPVRPGDQLRSEVTMKRFRKKLCVIEGRAFVDDELVAEGEFTAMIMEKGKDGEDGQDS